MDSIQGKFSNWVHVNNKNELLKKLSLESAGHHIPGVYAIAYSNNDISGKKFDYIEDIIYFGMSINKKGLKGRLYQFFRTINGKSKEHSGAVRIYHELSKNDEKWKDKIYISLMPCIYCAVNMFTPQDLIYMGDIAKQEYICLSKYAEKYKKMPRFCNKPK